MSKEISLFRLPRVLAKRGKCRSAHYTDVAEGTFPRGVKVSARAVAWPSYEVDAVNAAVVAGATKDQLRELVRKLERQRFTGLTAVGILDQEGA